LRIAIPPEIVLVTTTRPEGLGSPAASVFVARVAKARPLGQLVNLVLAADGFELNSLHGIGVGEQTPSRLKETVFVTLLTAAIRTSPLEEEE
jgi:hypothetical protein